MPYEDSESEESSGGEEGIKHFWFDKKQKQISILTCIFFWNRKWLWIKGIKTYQFWKPNLPIVFLPYLFFVTYLFIITPNWNINPPLRIEKIIIDYFFILGPYWLLTSCPLGKITLACMIWKRFLVLMAVSFFKW